MIFYACKRLFPYTLLIGVVCLFMTLYFKVEITFLKYDNINNIYYLDLQSYFSNINVALRNFVGDLGKRYNDIPLKFDGSRAEWFKSIGNLCIAILNTLIAPISIGGIFINSILSLIGLPLNNTNFLYVILNSFSQVYVPYIPL